MPRVFLPYLLTLLLAGCATAPPSKPQAEDSTAPVAVEIEFETPAGWEEIGRQYFDSTGMGAQLRLRLVEWPWVKLDLFAYEVGVTDDLAAGLGEVVDAHRAEMDYAVEQQSYAGWTLLAEADFELDDHPLLMHGKRLSLRIQRTDGEQGSTSYLFYRPPFALKVRASYPGFADERTERAIDEAVRVLIPAVEVIAPAQCAERKIEVSLPSAEGLDEEEESRLGVVALAAGMLRHALRGCMDLATALTMTDMVCTDYKALCEQPPWTTAEE